MTCTLGTWLGLSGCWLALGSALGGQPFSAAQTSQFYARATNEFAVADFYKPVGTTNSGPAFDLAPLIMQEVSSSKVAAEEQSRPGSLPDGLHAIDQAPRAMYEYADAVQLNGKRYSRATFVWCYASPAHRKASVGLLLQGIRLTLNSHGQPAIWEVLADSSAAESIFVSQSLEAAAEAEFGKPLAGRRYAIERSIEDAPRVAVARVIDDGPVAMGPIIYLQAGTHDVSTVICRCMAAQVKTLRATHNYRLMPFPTVAAKLGLMRAKLTAPGQPAFWPGDAPSEQRVEKCLRLPRAF
jgi:hypothetical protein